MLFERDLGITKDPEGRDLYQRHRAAPSPGPVGGGDAAMAPPPVAAATSPAYRRMTEMAKQLAEREGTSEAVAFAKVYEGRPDLAAEDKLQGLRANAPDATDATPAAGYDRLMEIARGLMGEDPSMTEALAFLEAARSNPELFSVAKRYTVTAAAGG